MKAVLDALGVSYVVEQGQDESGNWYRRFSNGWVEQGGKTGNIPSSGITVDFPIEFSSIEYSVFATANWNVQKNELGLICNNVSTSSCVIYLRSYNAGTPNIPVCWEAKGFAD